MDNSLDLLLTLCSPLLFNKVSKIEVLFNSPQFSTERLLYLAALYNLSPLTQVSLNRLLESYSFSEKVKSTMEKLHHALEKKRVAFLIHNMKLHKEMERLTGILKVQGIWSMALKGTKLAINLFGGLDTRVIGDIDILVRPEKLFNAKKTLNREGYYSRHSEDTSVELLKSHHLELWNDNRKILVELHWTPVQNERMPYFIKHFWEDNTLWNEEHSDFSNIGLWLYLMLHHHEHAYGEFKTLVESAWITQKQKSPELLEKTANRYGFSGCWYLLQKQLTHYFEADPAWFPPTNKIRLHQQLAVKMLEEVPLSPTKNLYKRKLYARFLLSDMKEILKGLFYTVFPDNVFENEANNYSKFKAPFVYIKKFFKRRK